MQFISDFFGYLLGSIFIMCSSYPLSIILLTILVKTVLVPLSIYQYRYQKSMNAVQPKMKELQDKYKNDKEALNVKMMELYKEHKVNPFAGCLPLIIQMPIFIALFNALREPAKYVFHNNAVLAQQALGQKFFWITDLSKPDFLGNVLSVQGFLATMPGILPLFAALTTYLQMKTMNMGNHSQDNQAMNDQMKMMANMMPIVILVTGYQMPAGLMIYWSISNVYQIAQQYLTNVIAEKSLVKSTKTLK